jgi:NitT/TauT family transport system substrate-binding protein
LADLKGRRLAVAGGPLDKNWLLMRASLQRDGLDVRSQATIIYGAPPLAEAAVLNGGADATLNYWNFCAALEGKGYRRIATTQDLVTKLGAKGPVAMIGYVFDKEWADAHRDALTRFIEITRKAKEILANSDQEWQSISGLIGAPDASTLRLYRDRYREGIPRRPIEDEEKDASILYRVLAKIGGPDLVGPGSELDPGTFYHLPPGD